MIFLYLSQTTGTSNGDDVVIFLSSRGAAENAAET